MTRSGPIVVLVFSHRDPGQVHRLVGRLQEGRDVFVAIHHEPAGERLRDIEASDVALVPDPLHCAWGRVQMAEAMWRSLSWVASAVPELSWVLLISGQDYPAMPIRQLEHELRTTPHDAFLRHFRLDDDPALDVHPWQQIARRRYLRSRRVPFTARSMPWPRRHPFGPTLHPFAGDVWFNLSAEAVRHALDSPALADELLRFLRGSANADELFIPTLVLNQQDHLDVVSDRRRFVRFAPGAPHPRELNVDDVPEIIASGAFFARKVDSRNGELLAALDAVTSAAADHGGSAMS